MSVCCLTQMTSFKISLHLKKNYTSKKCNVLIKYFEWQTFHNAKSELNLALNCTSAGMLNGRLYVITLTSLSHKMIIGYFLLTSASLCLSWPGCFFANKRMTSGVLKASLIAAWIACQVEHRWKRWWHIIVKIGWPMKRHLSAGDKCHLKGISEFSQKGVESITFCTTVANSTTSLT